MLTAREMPFHSGITLRIYPSNVQKRIIAKNDGAQRAIYNKLVAYNMERYRLSKAIALTPCYNERLDYLDQVLGKISELQNMLPFLNDKEIDSLAIANGSQNYRKAWVNYRKHPEQFGIPTFHKKGSDKAYQTNPHYAEGQNSLIQGNARFVDTKFLMLPKLGRIRYKGSDSRVMDLLMRTCDTKIGTITVSMNAVGEYFVSFQLGSVEPFVEHLPKTGGLLGIDANVSNFYTDSEGNVVENPKFVKRAEERLKKTQQVMSRRGRKAKQDGRTLRESKNYQKARLKYARAAVKVARQRTDFQNVQSKRLVKNQDLTVAEELKVKNLLKNHSLAKSVADVSWGTFFTMLRYKSEMYGKVFVQVPPQYTTQTCSVCGYIMRDGEHLDLNVREWDCPQCEAHHIRDHNAAINILNKGLALLA